ncbi:MAG: hypothetical protein ABI743_12520, partial [bacterium]
MTTLTRRHYPILIGTLLMVLAMAAACQHERGDVTTPGEPNPMGPVPQGLIIEDSDGAGHIAGQGALGMFQFHLDPDNLTATIEPVARATDGIGNPFMMDITGFLAGASCGDCFKIDGVGLTADNYVYVDYSIRHPFPLPEANPPNFGDRLDLHVFDVRGIFLKSDPEDERAVARYANLQNIGPEASTLAIDNSGFLAGITLDGVTSAFDEYTDTFFPTAATAHPFVLMREDTANDNFDAASENGCTDLRNPHGHNVFPQGGGPYIKRVVFTAHPGDQVNYLVVLAANFAQAAQGQGLALGKRGNPVYYLPWANSKAPWRVRVIPGVNDLKAGDTSTKAHVEVDIWDWQHHLSALTVVDAFRIDNQSRNSLLQPSRITDVDGSVPGVAEMGDVNSGFLAGAGTPQDPLRYDVVIPNTLGADAGTFSGAIRVSDEYEPPPGALEGIDRNLTPFQLKDFSTYITFSIEVHPGAGETGFGGGASVYNPPGGQPVDPNEAVTLDDGVAGNLGIFNDTLGSTEFDYAVCETSGFSSQTESDVAFCTSTNGGVSFGQGQLLGTTLTGNQSEPEMVVGPGSGPGTHIIHVVFVNASNATGKDVYYTRSTNGGSSWSAPVRVHSDASGDQDNPSIAVNTLTSPASVIVAYANNRGTSHGIGVTEDGNGNGVWTNPEDTEVVVDQVSGSLVPRRLHPSVTYAPAALGQPNFIAMTWETTKSLAPDIKYTSTSTGISGLGLLVTGVSGESLTQRAVSPSILLA